MPNKDNILSNLDTTQVFTTDDVQTFDIGADVVNNQLIVEQSDGTTRNAGPYQGTKGRETVDVVFDADGKLVQINNNGLPNDEFGRLQYNVGVEKTFNTNSQMAVYTGNRSVQGQNLIKKQLTDTAIYIDPVTSTEYLYVIPSNLAWIGTTAGQVTASTTEGITVTTNSSYSSQFDLRKMFNRTTSGGLDGHLWQTGTAVNRNYFTIEFPSIKSIEGFRFRNMRTDYATTSFVVSGSTDNITFTPLQTVSLTAGNLLAEHTFTFAPTKIRFMRFNVITANATGSVGRFEPITTSVPAISDNHEFIRFRADERFYNINETSSEFQLSTKTIGDIQNEYIYTTGLLKWEKYSKFEQRLTTTTTSSIPAGFSTRALNSSTVNNLLLTTSYPAIIIKPGVYFVKGQAISYRSAYYGISLIDSNSITMIDGTVSYCDSSATNTSSSISTIEGLVYITEDTPVLMRQYCSVAQAQNIAQGDGVIIPGVNESESYASLEMWKVMDIEELVDGSEQDSNWNNVLLLLNGTNTWADQSKYSNPVINNGDVTLTPGNYGLAYNTSGAVKYLQTIVSPSFVIGIKNFAIDAWIYPLSFVANQTIMSDNIHSTASSWALYISGTLGSIGFNNGSTVITTGQGALSVNQWHHISVSRNNGILKMFVNGIMVASGPMTASLTGNRIQVGKANNVATSFNGYIGNARVTIGGNRYADVSTYFLVPTELYTKNTADIPYAFNELDVYYDRVTALLNGEDNFSDKSVFNFPVTNTSMTTSTGPRGTVYVATGLQRASVKQALYKGTQDFTGECWFKRNSTIENNGIFGYGTFNLAGGSCTLFTMLNGDIRLHLNSTVIAIVTQAQHNANLDNWTHVAVTRVSGNFYVYVNGFLVGSSVLRADDFNTVQQVFIGSLGAAYPGSVSISDFRYTIGVNRYSGHFIPPATSLIPDYIDSSVEKFNDVNWKDVVYYATPESGTITELSEYAKSFTVNGTFTYPVQTWPDGTNRPVLDCGTGKSAIIPLANSAHLALRNRNFTAEAWVKVDAGSAYFVIMQGGVGTSTNLWRIQARVATSLTKISVYIGNISTSVNAMTCTSDIVVGVWTHVALTRNGNTFKLFINGVQEATVTSAVSINNGADSTLSLGATSANIQPLTGVISEARVSLFDRYPVNFTPDTYFGS